MQSFSKKSLVGLAVVAAVIVAVTAWRSHVAGTGRHAASAHDESPGMTVSPATPSTTMAARTPLPAPVPTDAEMLAEREAGNREAQKVVEAGKSKLVRQYRGEKVDAQWASAKEQRLQSLSTTAEMTSLNAIPTDMQVDCRSSVCRITATFRSRVAADDWFTLYALNVGAEMPNASFESHVNPDGTVGVQVHGLARK